MLVKIILVFLLVMVAIGMLGNLVTGGRLGRSVRRSILPKAATCPKCGRHLIGRSGCDCGKKAG